MQEDRETGRIRIRDKQEDRKRGGLGGGETAENREDGEQRMLEQ